MYVHDPYVQADRNKTKVQDITRALQAKIKLLCDCNFTSLHITREVLSCSPSAAAVDWVSFRAQLFGTQSHSSAVLLEYLQGWIDSGNATLDVLNSRLSTDASCPLVIDSLDMPQCYQLQSSVEDRKRNGVLIIVLPVAGFVVVVVSVLAILLTSVAIFRMLMKNSR